MKFSEIANRLTGISTPLGGVSWQTPELEVSAARRVIAHLEDRRVLYAPDSFEVPSHCVQSIMEIRQFLTDELGKLDSKAKLAANLRAMRAACRRFLDCVGSKDGRNDVVRQANSGNWGSYTFFSALGEMRGNFGVHLARIAVRFRLDIEDQLAAILPADVSDEDNAQPTRQRQKSG